MKPFTGRRLRAALNRVMHLLGRRRPPDNDPHSYLHSELPMRVWIRLPLCTLIVCTAMVHAAPMEQEGEVRISKITIISNSLPESDRQRLISLFQRGTYPPDKIRTRVQFALQELGYFKAVVEEPEISFPEGSEHQIAAVAIRVREGARYHLGDIQFMNVTQFPTSRLHPLFQHLHGAAFTTPALGIGLNQLMELYQACGYSRATVVPTLRLDELSRAIDLTIEVDEGSRSAGGRCN